MAQEETFYNLRLPLPLKKWVTSFQKHERSTILRAFISIMIAMASSPTGRKAVIDWANGRRTLLLISPTYIKGCVVPPTFSEALNEENME